MLFRSAEVQAQIEHERMIDFPLENLRWYDLRRWGKTAEALFSVTTFPAVLPPKNGRKLLPAVLFCGLSLERNILLNRLSI